MTSTRFKSRSPLRALKRYAAAACLATVFSLGSPVHAFAREDPDAVHYDARVQGYSPDVELKGGGLGMIWMMFVLLGVVSVSVIFKDAKRSHLD